ncbi:MAG: DUF4124 domain-containing protein [Candidatus Binatia bacterium]
MSKAVTTWLLLLLFSGVASADIIGWRDEHGVRHYTNLKAEVPKEQQQSAHIVVNEMARRRPAAEVAASRETAAPEVATRAAEPRREAEVVYDRSQISAAYVEGFRRGMEAAGGFSAGGGVRIAGPLAVANATTAAPSYGYGTPYFHPFVTTSFDRGRSRHLTLRLLLQDQFALDREAPFVFEERLLPPFGHLPLGVALNPFLPRGLPHGFPHPTRVIVR